jgi:hypothetical protein
LERFDEPEPFAPLPFRLRPFFVELRLALERCVAITAPFDVFRDNSPATRAAKPLDLGPPAPERILAERPSG